MTNPPEPSMPRFSCLYFGYASNLSPRTIKQRCPDSLFVGLGVLKGWKWMINETGYANIIPGDPESDEVYGSLSFLSPRDEAGLDESEGVPWMYTKQTHKIRRVLQPEELAEYGGSDGALVAEVDATTYVDVERTTEGKIDREYIVWVKKAIEDGEKLGMPKEYSAKYIEGYLPKGYTPNMNIMMVRTMQIDDKDGKAIPRGFASWTRG